MALEVINVGSAVVPVDGREVEVALAVAATQPRLQVIKTETGTAVGDRGRADVRGIGEVALDGVHVFDVIGGGLSVADVGLGTKIGLVEGEEVARAVVVGCYDRAVPGGCAAGVVAPQHGDKFERLVETHGGLTPGVAPADVLGALEVGGAANSGG